MVEGGRGRAFDEGEERDGIGGKKSWGMSAELAQDGYTREFLLEKKRRWRENPESRTGTKISLPREYYHAKHDWCSLEHIDF